MSVNLPQNIDFWFSMEFVCDLISLPIEYGMLFTIFSEHYAQL